MLPSLRRLGAVGYIARAKELGRQSLLGTFHSTGERFDAILKGMECVKVEDGHVECKVLVTEAMQNSYGTMHGGCTATIVDVLGTMALLTKDSQRPGVSVEMSQSFLAPAKGGEVVFATGVVTKYGRALGFTEVRLTDVHGKLLATGRHTKAFPAAG
ncbi:unnamed protein product [Cladocopium goreaui]|uniref:Acyl-coenzyme A thioesterase 13 n=1 Tax=Cladocopium goreaui TaxID=2562237 RepID=A0A9P1FYW7_9DINO|nr:unnamed protein product [Cladocopium goreaui]